jgi:hypothetical protein
VLPLDVEWLSDEPFADLDIEAFERWAKTGEGAPWSHGA